MKGKIPLQAYILHASDDPQLFPRLISPIVNDFLAIQWSLWL